MSNILKLQMISFTDSVEGDSLVSECCKSGSGVSLGCGDVI